MVFESGTRFRNLREPSLQTTWKLRNCRYNVPDCLYSEAPESAFVGLLRYSSSAGYRTHQAQLYVRERSSKDGGREGRMEGKRREVKGGEGGREGGEGGRERRGKGEGRDGGE